MIVTTVFAPCSSAFPTRLETELRQPVSIPLPPQVAHRFIANDRCRMKRLEFKDRVLTNLLQVSWRSLDGNARSEPRTRQIQQVGDQAIHTLRATQHAGPHPRTLRVAVGCHREQRCASGDGAERRAQVVAQNANELIPVEVHPCGIPHDGCRERLVDGLVKAAHTRNVRAAPVIVIEPQDAGSECPKFREDLLGRESVPKSARQRADARTLAWRA
jgi:hypothetical protein